MLNSIKQSFDSLKTNIESFISYAESIEQKEKLNIELDHKLRDRDNIINKKVEEHLKSVKKLEEDKALIDKKIIQLEEDRRKSQNLESEREEIRKEKEIIKESHSKLDSRESLLIEKEKKYLDMNDREIELNHRETLLKKEMLQDKKRQEDLDLRENELNKEKERIQKIADSLQNIKP